MDELGNLREEIFAKIKEYYLRAHTPKPFVPGETRLQYGGRVFDEREMLAMVDAVLEFWLTAGRYTREFEERLSKFLGVREVIPVNSGSSANLVAVTTLCSPQLQDRLQPGDEVITPATTFPTTLAPIVQNRLVPVLIDCELGTYNLQVNDLERALSQKTRAIFLPHTLGNPAPMDRVVEFAREHRLYLIEDTCDALGSAYSGQMVGTFGQLATVSFYPAHHITTGEGGAVYTNDLLLARIARTLRDWGRGDGCNSGGEAVPEDGDRDAHYYFTEIGYNLKLTEIQAALGVAQLEKLQSFAAARRRNFKRLYEGMVRHEGLFILPRWLPQSDPCWFAFPLTVRDQAPFSRADLTAYLESRGVETRILFGGNILKQPGYKDIQCRVIGDLSNAEQVRRGTFFVGVYPGLDDSRIDYMLESVEDFLRDRVPDG